MRRPNPSRSRSARCQTCSTGEKEPAGPGVCISCGVSDSNVSRRNVFIAASDSTSSCRWTSVSLMYCMGPPSSAGYHSFVPTRDEIWPIASTTWRFLIPATPLLSGNFRIKVLKRLKAFHGEMNHEVLAARASSCLSASDSVRIQPLRRPLWRSFVFNPAAPASAASQRRTERAALSIGSLHATLRSVFHRPSRPERAGAGDDRALPRHGDLERRKDPPPRGLGPPPARFPARQGAQGGLRAHEYRVRQRDAHRARALVQVQRRGVAAPDH